MQKNGKAVKIKTSNTIIYCLKWKKTVEFYKNKLNLEILFSNDWFVEFKLTDSSRLSVADSARTSIGSSSGKGLTLTFEVDNIDKTYLFLKEADLNPPSIKDHGWGAKVIYIFDPEGSRIEFWCPET